MKKVKLVKNTYKLMAMDEEGNLYTVHGLVIKKDDNSDVFYSPDSAFFKIACPVGTWHQAEEASRGLVNLY